VPETPDLGKYEYIELPDAKRDIARNRFLIALLEIDREGYAGKLVNDNPLKLLRDLVLPKWHSAMHSPQPAPRRRSNNFLDYLAEKDQTGASVSEILNQWAADCGLMESDQDGKLRPAGWMIAFAKQFCTGLSSVELGQAEPPWWAKRATKSIGSAEGTIITPTGMFVPMENPAPRPDESLKDFKRRARNAFTAYLHVWEHTRALAAPEGIGTSRRKTALKSGRKGDVLDHFRWLALYQCCRGWSLKKIAPDGLTEQAISQGLREKAKLIGLEIRRRR